MNQKAKISTREIDKESVELILEGRVNAEGAEELEETLWNLVDKNNKKFILINLEKVSYLGSSGIRIFLALTNKLNKIGGKLFLIKIPLSGQKIIKAMEIEDRFLIYSTVEEALQNLKK